MFEDLEKLVRGIEASFASASRPRRMLRFLEHEPPPPLAAGGSSAGLLCCPAA
jgi:hypothetical protein